ncbi:TPA: hypothetical protein N0F65_005623 [Lagenidium giganteum]|uniref:HSF-type DNA-binding domain-containing protein n=1 Tax=Lagenidium giganteum TaxID=4803 RepID=A0AAV2YYA9_9STRA|nr:TPA: hypothetical protein N0F65_005623 [Lagenidium giganteum]
MRSAAPADSSSAPPRVEIPPYMEPEFAHATEHAAALSHRPLQSRMPLASPCTTAAASALFHVTQQRLQSIETPRHEHEQRIESLDEHKYERECEQQEKSTDARPSALTTSAARGDAAERRPAAGTSASPSGGDVKKRNVGIPKFLRFLFQMLEFEDRAIISWSHKGTAFQIRQPDELAERVLPKYFKHNKVSSFQRQLNYFGFKKWTKTQTNICTFSHPHFIRGEKEKMKLIKRKERGSTGHPANSKDWFNKRNKRSATNTNNSSTPGSFPWNKTELMGRYSRK